MRCSQLPSRLNHLLYCCVTQLPAATTGAPPTRPPPPSTPCHHLSPGIHQINDSELLTTGADGALMVWDVRNAEAGPVKFAVPDSK